MIAPELSPLPVAVRDSLKDGELTDDSPKTRAAVFWSLQSRELTWGAAAAAAGGDPVEKISYESRGELPFHFSCGEYLSTEEAIDYLDDHVDVYLYGRGLRSYARRLTPDEAERFPAAVCVYVNASPLGIQRRYAPSWPRALQPLIARGAEVEAWIEGVKDRGEGSHG